MVSIFLLKSGVQVLSLIQEMLPHIAALNLLAGSSQISEDSEIQMPFTSPITTSTYYTWLESEHPYKPATVSHYKVTFPETVKWLTVEFTPDCGTAQPEDYLQLYIPNLVANSPRLEKFVCMISSRIVLRCIVNNLYRSSGSPNLNENQAHYPVLRKLSNVPSQWPQNAVVLPGMLAQL